MLATAERAILNQVGPGEKISILRGLVAGSFRLLNDHKFPNGTIPASLGRYDDEHFKGTIWVRDVAHAVQFALDPDFNQAFPHLQKDARSLYLSAIHGILEMQTNPEQIERFKSKPGWPDKDGYYSLGDQQAPAIKFYGYDGSIVREWGHNQPDSWGILLLEAGKGIEAGLTVLEAERFNPGETLANITSYVTNLKVERLNCRSIWERDHLKSPYSTRRIVLAGLEQMLEIWDQIEQDSQIKAYQLPINQKDLLAAAKSLRGLVREHEGDFTDLNHPFAGDLSSLVVLNDVKLPIDEQTAVIKSITEGELENSLGCYRWVGDSWKENEIEAKWTIGKPMIAKYHLEQAKRLAITNPSASLRHLDHGLDRMQHILDIFHKYHYIPELFEYGSHTTLFRPNNNDLAWTRSAVIGSASKGIVALQMLTGAA
ncbi:MAG: hypothetical protein NUV73_01080 [Candidatus Daviesbacteria bacterium]|nr:hypothetical protein [Candidatus Daviesbacteria bacterium]